MMETWKNPTDVKLDVGKIRVALGDPDTHGFVLLTILMWTFGPYVFGDDELGVDAADPAELWAATNTRYGTWITEEGENRVQALLTVMRTGGFYEEVDVFQAVVGSLFDGDVMDIIDEQYDPPGAVEIMWAMLEVELALDLDEHTPELAPAVAAYMAECLKHEQDDMSEVEADVHREYLLMLDQLREMGLGDSALRKIDGEYVDAIQMAEERMLASGEISAGPAS